jgi:hypothetical protein
MYPIQLCSDAKPVHGERALAALPSDPAGLLFEAEQRFLSFRRSAAVHG